MSSDHKCYLSVTCYHSNYEIGVCVNILSEFYYKDVVNLGVQVNTSTPKIHH